MVRVTDVIDADSNTSDASSPKITTALTLSLKAHDEGAEWYAREEQLKQLGSRHRIIIRVTLQSDQGDLILLSPFYETKRPG